MSQVVVFLGPTLTVEEARAELGIEGAVFLPPPKQGDLYLVAKDKPLIIGLIDGRFDQVNAVAHKEILWAMSQGIHVYGAASMGALRAAELDSFGMVGVGSIYQQYASGRLTDDDEVAVAHAGSEHRYRPLSDALVDIRATLQSALANGVLTHEEVALIIAAAKKRFYPERSFRRLAPDGIAAGLSLTASVELYNFLEEGRVLAKARDARDLLRAIREHHQADAQPKRVPWLFSHTDAFAAIIRRAEQAYVNAMAPMP